MKKNTGREHIEDEIDGVRLLTWDELPRGAVRITWDCPPHPGQTEADKELARRLATHEMVLHSMFAHYVRLHCTAWGAHKTCHSAQCRRQGRCATLRSGKPPDHGSSIGRMFHHVMPICVPREQFFEVRDVVRNNIWGPPPYKKQ